MSPVVWQKNIGRINSAIILVRLLLFSSQKLYVACLVFLMNRFIRKPLCCWNARRDISRLDQMRPREFRSYYFCKRIVYTCTYHIYTYRVRSEKSQRLCPTNAQIHDSIPIRGDSAPTRLAKSLSSPVQLAIQLYRYVNVTPIE